MKEIGRYDSDMQMFVQPPRDPDMNHLRFLRSLAERGQFDHKPVSVPKGENVFRLTIPEIRKYAMIQADQETVIYERPKPNITEHIQNNGDY